MLLALMRPGAVRNVGTEEAETTRRMRSGKRRTEKGTTGAIKDMAELSGDIRSILSGSDIFIESLKIGDEEIFD